jgi:hypothetical protein
MQAHVECSPAMANSLAIVLVSSVVALTEQQEEESRRNALSALFASSSLSAVVNRCWEVLLRIELLESEHVELGTLQVRAPHHPMLAFCQAKMCQKVRF